MSVKCGNRKRHGTDVVHHESAMAVRQCFAAKPLTAPSTPRDSDTDLLAGFQEVFATKQNHRRGAEQARYAEWASIPVAGSRNYAYYAVERHGSTIFYRVQRPSEGKWAGKTFLSRQRSDSFDRVEDFSEVISVLNEIAMDPRAAGERYGREIGQCYLCHRALTDPDSRAAGVGPDCAKKR